jgi:hypothetical protein
MEDENELYNQNAHIKKKFMIPVGYLSLVWEKKKIKQNLSSVFTLGKALGPWALPKSGSHSALSCANPYSGKAHNIGLYPTSWNLPGFKYEKDLTLAPSTIWCVCLKMVCSPFHCGIWGFLTIVQIKAKS